MPAGALVRTGATFAFLHHGARFARFFHGAGVARFFHRALAFHALIALSALTFLALRAF